MGYFVAALALAAVPTAHAAKGDDPGKTKKEIKRERAAEGDGGKRADREQRAVAAPDSAQMAKLRERMDVTDDAEWQLIFDRIQKVADAKRALQVGARPAGPRGSAGAERDALRQAVSDQAPDAEIKARLARAHEAQQQKEKVLAQAEQDLRSILTVRQEAVAVLAGLLTP